LLQKKPHKKLNAAMRFKSLRENKTKKYDITQAKEDNLT